MSMLKDLFKDQALVDERTPSFTFEIPGVEGTWGFFPPVLQTWLLFIYFLVIQTGLQVSAGVIIYQFVVKRRGSLDAYLLGWGVIIPISIYIPFLLLDYTEFRNRMVSLSVGNVMTVIFFRCIAAMYGTSPPFVEDSLMNYVAYYSSAVPFVWDPKTRARKSITGPRLAQKFFNVLSAYTFACVILSFLRHHDHEYFPSEVDLGKFEFTTAVFSLGHLGNSYIHALLMYNTLKFAFELSAFGENAKGIDTLLLFDQPLTMSRSPTEFWTKRWNIYVRRLLKYGVFLPAKQFFDNRIAVFLTFVASGVYHDYVWWIVFHDVKDGDGNCIGGECFDHEFGRVSLFFTYVGLIMMLERPISKIPIVQSLAKTLPSFVVAHMLLFIHIPFIYFYYGDWVNGGFFDHFSIAVWQIKKI